MNNSSVEMVECPCCGNRTISVLGDYEICPICLWEDDPVQFKKPNMEGGANEPSLNQAREIWFNSSRRK